MDKDYEKDNEYEKEIREEDKDRTFKNDKQYKRLESNLACRASQRYLILK